MLRQEFVLKSPMRILQKATGGGVGTGNLGVVMARAGVGKTACLVHVALDHLFQGRRALHVGIGEGLDKTRLRYREILDDLCRAIPLEHPHARLREIEAGRTILSYTDDTFSVQRLHDDLHDLESHGGVQPHVLLVDGFDFEAHASWDTLAAFKYLAAAHDTEIWFAARTHRHASRVNERGIPAPCHTVDDLFSVILFLEPQAGVVQLRLLKDHGRAVDQELPLRLDPTTLLLMDEDA